jgi:phospholipid/cholesterol/gamma-HCH transport system substrate-binding protein
MNNKMSAVRLGIFIFIGTVILVIGIFLLGNKESMFKSTFTVKTYFRNVEGLRTGAPVRLSGIDVGSVKDIRITGDTSGKVEVTLRLIHEIHQFIRTDTKASIETEGLVGNKIMILHIGSSASQQVAEGGFIQSKESIGFAAIIEETQGALQYTKAMTKDLSEIINKVNNGEGSIGKLINDDALYNNTNRLLSSADKSLGAITTKLDELTDLINSLGEGVQSVITHVDKAVVNIDDVIKNIKSGKGVLGNLVSDKSEYDTSIVSILNNIVKISDETRKGASRFAENMEALKHNWLFKNYFEQRGYWEKSEYEAELDAKLNELKERTSVLDKKIETLKKLEEKYEKNK